MAFGRLWKGLTASVFLGLGLGGVGLSDPGIRMLNRVVPPPAIPSDIWSKEIYDRSGELVQVVNARDGVTRLAFRSEHRSAAFEAWQLRYEDHEFYVHRGVSARAIGRALWHSATHCRPWHCHFVSGASTITMQLVKRIEPRSRTFWSKGIEVIRARQLEVAYDKRTLLDLYYSWVPVGGALEGFRAASLAYFGREVGSLDVAEAALLIVMPQAPSRTMPERYPANARRQRNKILERLHVYGMISAETRDEGFDESIPSRRRTLPFEAPHYGLRVAARAASYGETRIETRLDRRWQVAARRWLRGELAGAANLNGALVVFERGERAFSAYVGSVDFRDRERSGPIDHAHVRRLPCELVLSAVAGASGDPSGAAPSSCDAPGVRDGLRRRSLELPVALDDTRVSISELARLAWHGPLRCPPSWAGGQRCVDAYEDGSLARMSFSDGGQRVEVVDDGERVVVLWVGVVKGEGCARCGEEAWDLGDHLVRWVAEMSETGREP